MVSTRNAVVAIYAIISISIFAGVEPLKTTGLVLGLCFLPGFLLFALGKREDLGFEDIFLSFPVSIGISSILILGLLLAGLHVNHVPYVIHLIITLAIVLDLIFIRKTAGSLDIGSRELKFCLFSFVMVLLFSVPIFLGPNRVAVASHAFFHSSIVNQVLNGIFPPDNPGLGGVRVGFYWGFHSLIAAIASQSGFQQIQLVFALNALSLYMVFCLAYIFARAFDLSEGYRYLLPLAVIGIMRTDAGLFFLANLIRGNILPFENMALEPLEPFDLLTGWIQGIPLLDSRMFFLNKYYNVSGMPLAIFLILSYFLHLLIILKRGLAESRLYLISMSCVIVACFFIYPPLAIIILMHGPLWILYVFFSTPGVLKKKFRTGFSIALPYLIAILPVSPYLLLVTDSFSSGQGSVLKPGFYLQSLENLAVFVIPFPVIIYGIRVAIKRLGFVREMYFLLISTFLCFGLAVFTRVYFDNSYKFNFILTFFFALFFVIAIADLLPRIKGQWAQNAAAVCVIAVIMFTPFVVMSSYVVSSLSTDYVYAFSEGHMNYAQEIEKNDAYIWIRENTPPESLIMLSYIETNWPCCGLNSNYEAAALSERSLFVVKDADFTERNPECQKRIIIREKLFNDPADSEVAAYFASMKKPVYLLLEKDMSYRFLVEERFKGFPQMSGQEFQLVFSSDRQRIYLITINKT